MSSPYLETRPSSQAHLAKDLVRLIAPNPSPMTFWGTNTYLLGKTEIAVIDPGPDDPKHLAAIEQACPKGAKITHILVTHAHLDHSPGAPPLSQATGAPVYGFGPATAGRSAVMERLAHEGLAGGGEGVDAAFDPDHALRDGDILTSADWSLKALHTPGHMGNHLSFAWNDTVFCGDLVLAWSSSLVSPPDGDLTDFMASCRRLQGMNFATAYPGHGPEISVPKERLTWLLDHRASREAQIIEALAQKPSTAEALARHIYTDTPTHLIPAATRNVFAHLVDLHGRQKVAAHPTLSTAATFSPK